MKRAAVWDCAGVPHSKGTNFQKVYIQPDGQIPRSATLMNEIFKKAIQDGASDPHIKAGDFVRARLNGELIPLSDRIRTSC